MPLDDILTEVTKATIRRQFDNAVDDIPNASYKEIIEAIVAAWGDKDLSTHEVDAGRAYLERYSGVSLES